MLPGQYVTLPDGTVGQLVRTINQAVDGAHGLAVDGTLYEVSTYARGLVYAGPVPNKRPPGWTEDDYRLAVSDAPTLVPACVTCSAAAGEPCVPACASENRP